MKNWHFTHHSKKVSMSAVWFQKVVGFWKKRKTIERLPGERKMFNECMKTSGDCCSII